MLIEPSAACCLVTLNACCAPGASVLAISEMGHACHLSWGFLPGHLLGCRSPIFLTCSKT